MAQQTIATHPTLNRIRERGYWRIIIRPAQFDPERIAEPQQLAPLVASAATHHRRGEFPSIGNQATLAYGNDWLENAVDWEPRLEYWRLYQSGQFLHYAALSEDWNTRSFRWHTQSGIQAGVFLPIYDSVYRVTEIFEFAANLALSRVYSAGSIIHIELLCQSLSGRQLYNDAATQRTIFLIGNRPANESVFRRALDIPISDLVANSHDLALQTVERLIRLFHWQVTPGLLKQIQAEFSEA